jgi:hypothetical protein
MATRIPIETTVPSYRNYINRGGAAFWRTGWDGLCARYRGNR